ncbi:unnamed protein product [Prunus brigantina]
MGKRVGGRKWMIRSQKKTWGLNKDGMGLCLDTSSAASVVLHLIINLLPKKRSKK